MRNSKTCLEKRKNIDLDKIQELEDTVAILTEQIVSLKLELDSKDSELLELAEELNFTNQELCSINELLTNTLVSPPSNEPKKSNKNSLASKKSAKSSLFVRTDFHKIEV